MKTRLRDLLKNNKLLNIVSNRYNLDKEDRKTLNEMISNQGGGADDGMEYYLVLDSVNMSGRYGVPVCSVIIDGKIYNRDSGNIIALNVSNKILITGTDYTMKEILISYGNDLTDSSKFKQITAKEYYSLLN